MMVFAHPGHLCASKVGRLVAQRGQGSLHHIESERNAV